eukprot:8479261-Alexandrium_andersonii.AAC.1
MQGTPRKFACKALQRVLARAPQIAAKRPIHGGHAENHGTSRACPHALARAITATAVQTTMRRVSA